MNPWHKRANEFIRDASELLPLISPQPISKFFRADSERLFDRLVVVVGAPGSGKTTLARLLELRTLATMRDFERHAEVRELVASFAQAGILEDLSPAVLALRLPTGGQLRAIWELPYDERLRHRLLRAVIQAKSVLGWLRQLEDVEVDIKRVRVVTTGFAEAAREAVRADDITQFRERARVTERAIFRLTGALVPPSEAELGGLLAEVAYEPFSIVESIEIPETTFGAVRRLRPMVILDDAHELHPQQLEDIDRWLRDREIKVARWILTRADSLNLEEFRRVLLEEERITPGTQPGRDRVRVLLQDTGNRDRTGFKSVAEDVARRYLLPLASLSRRGSLNLRTLLNTAPAPMLGSGDLRALEAENARQAEEIGLSAERLEKLEAAYPDDVTADVKAALTRIMLQREMRRSPQRSLFGPVVGEETPQELPRIQRALINGAKLQLLHRYDRPFYYGFECLADAANENIEQFVTLASVLVDQLETQAIRGRALRLDARQQHKAVREHAINLVDQWDFPYAPKVRHLVKFIASRCLDLTLRPNAPLADGANAYGVSIAELASLDTNEELARVLHYAIAYQAIVLIEPYECKGRTWALFELGGVPIIAHGLTLSRGGFAEGTVAQLKSALESAT
ncbi:hypothetical protein [Burkholderia ubonensis]|uniref:ORC-CDC6 family AAA ATPase n=1 Tax=Burkholderia ubonensis TaxID=101571 RepID=UPI000A8E16D8|nr:hypothetical protein [Burkholderia ubonensis]